MIFNISIGGNMQLKYYVKLTIRICYEEHVHA